MRHAFTCKNNDKGFIMDKRPNIILLMADQMRGDCLGIAGHPDVKTPFLDALAAEADAVEAAVDAVLAEGWRTPDIAGPGVTPIGTQKMGELICRHIG